MVSSIKQCAVIGHPVAHSLSPFIHHQWAAEQNIQLHYNLMDVDEDNFSPTVMSFFENKGLGLNVTLPYKQKAYELAHTQTLRSKEARSVNTLWMQNGVLHGDNTDGIGFIRDLSSRLTLDHLNVLILGAGGAARGILGPLLSSRLASLTLANRTLERALDLQLYYPRLRVCTLDQLDSSYDLIVHATSWGVTSLTNIFPPSILQQQPYCYDLVYNRSKKTPFLQWVAEYGCLGSDGLGMLIEQAAEAFFIWHGVRPDPQSMFSKIARMSPHERA